MTITYSLDVANTRFCGFTKLLLRWKGSIYKILWREFLVFSLGYSLLSITYRCFLTDKQRLSFEQVVLYFETFIDLIPLSFVLGFYVSLVIGRWWNQFDAIPWPDRLCYMIATYVHGADERSRIIRRTLGRYLILLQALTFQSVSTAVKRRFPTTQHLVAAGIMTKEERTVFEKVEAPYGKWWLPAQWFSALAMRARKEGRIKDSILLDGMFREFLNYRSACGTMFNYDWISVPLVYTQVVTLATYTYSVGLLVGRQYLNPAKDYPKHQVDLYVPIFTLLQFFFYVGWLKVAEQIVNPYGEDDDDFELNWCLDRNCQIVYLLVDHFHTKHPKLRRDAFWDELLPLIPQTKHTVKNVTNPQLGSAFNFEVNPADSEFLPMDIVLEEDNDANVYNSDSVKQAGGIRYRPSFLMNLFSAGMNQSVRRRSTRKGDSFRDASSLRGHSNPAFTISNTDKLGNPKGTTPSNSRSSSIAKKASPSHSRASSISFKPGSISRYRYKQYDVQQAENMQQQIGVVPDVDSNVVPLARHASTMANFENGTSAQIESQEGSGDNPIHLPESYMPPIPEEESRITSMVSEPSATPTTTTATHLDDVHNLVIEANKVLEELNRAVTAQGHKRDCGLKGYESCCSLSSSESSHDEEDVSNVTEPEEFGDRTVFVNLNKPNGEEELDSKLSSAYVV